MKFLITALVVMGFTVLGVVYYRDCIAFDATDVRITECYDVCRKQGSFPKHWDKEGNCQCGFMPNKKEGTNETR